jgi:hypothetical protein
MLHTIIPPREPQGQEPVRPPMIYVKKQLAWEYKQIVRNLTSESPLAEPELNELGKDGWEMSGIAQQASLLYYYFKRQIEN